MLCLQHGSRSGKAPSVAQVQKPIVGADPEDWDGDICVETEPEEKAPKDGEELEEKEELEKKNIRPAERHTDPHGCNPHTTIRTKVLVVWAWGLQGWLL